MKKAMFPTLILLTGLSCRAQDRVWEALSQRWAVLLPVESYTAETLHEYIDGAAELFRAYDIVDAVTATFFLPPDSALCFTVDLYRFAEPLDAFGVYARQAASGLPLNLGNAAATSSMSVKLWQNEYYVLLTACSPDSTMQQALLKAAEMISAVLPAPLVPREFLLLPKPDGVPLSLAYYRRNYPGIEGLERVLEARYSKNESEKRMILVRCRTEAERDQALRRIREAGGSGRALDYGFALLGEFVSTPAALQPKPEQMTRP